MVKHKQLIEPASFLPFWLLGSSIISAIIHNLLFSFSQTEDAVFFVLTLVLFLGFIASVIYNVLTYINNGRPSDIWKMGWLGFFGLFGIFMPGLYGFFGFFGFFGFKKK